jgi:hypothetical protein
MHPLSCARRRRRFAPRARALALAASLAAVPGVLGAQALDDGLMVGRGYLRSTVELSRDRWSEYWEGTLQRSNESIGAVTTSAVTYTVVYGVTPRLNLLATLPHVSTQASAGPLSDMEGWQDVTVGAKLRLLRARVSDRATLGLTALGAVGGPTSDYSPDFLPMSIGVGAKRATARGALHVKDRTNFFLDATVGHTWRSTVHLDRPAYYTDGSLTLSDEVAMPDVRDWTFGVGYQDATWCIPVMLMGQRTLGGGDIRRQDMPFPSNRMDLTRVGGKVMYTLPKVSQVIVSLGAARTLAGRNVGRSTTVSAGVTTHFKPF